MVAGRGFAGSGGMLAWGNTSGLRAESSPRSPYLWSQRDVGAQCDLTTDPAGAAASLSDSNPYSFSPFQEFHLWVAGLKEWMHGL